MRDGEASLAWAAIDTLCCLLLVVYTLIAPPPEQAAIETPGEYAIVVTWPDGLNDDVDLYVRDPRGRVVSYSRSTAGLMHLEHDDLGGIGDTDAGLTLTQNRERVILRGALPGEHTVNVHAYRLDSPRTSVQVSLYRLVGTDKRLATERVVLRGTGAEQTAFRFTIHDGRATGLNRLQRKLVQPEVLG